MIIIYDDYHQRWLTEVVVKLGVFGTNGQTGRMMSTTEPAAGHWGRRPQTGGHVMGAAAEEPPPASGSGSGAAWGFHKGGNRFGRRCRHRRATRAAPTVTMYRVTDRLHNGRTVDVPCQGIAGTVSAWLAELGTHTPLVEELARAVCSGDWPAAYAICDRLSVDVTVAA